MESALKKITIRDVPEFVVDRLDSIAAKKGYNSRNQLIVEILGAYVECEEGLFFKMLPPILKDICRNDLEIHKDNLKASTEIATRNISLAALQLLKVLQWFEQYIIADLPPEGVSALDTLIDDMTKSEKQS